ncbi:hypothetical protein E4U11_005618 [Claviceps purpurea]|nr:hypothetical protein E4U11_005618 [Claviceps purpurea]
MSSSKQNVPQRRMADLIRSGRRSYAASAKKQKHALLLLTKALNSRARIYEDLGKLDRAKKDAEWMLELAPRLPDGYLRLGKIARLQKNDEYAWKMYTAGIEANKETASGSSPKLQQLYNARKPLNRRYFKQDPVCLPTAFVTHMFSYLEPMDLLVCVRVCKEWKRTLTSPPYRHLWRNMTFTNRYITTRVHDMNKILSLAGDGGARNIEIGIGMRFPQSMLTLMLESSPSLERLEISELKDLSLPSKEKIWNQLRHVHIKSFAEVGKTAVDCPGGFPQTFVQNAAGSLEHLDLLGIPQQWYRGVSSMPLLPNLKTLRMVDHDERDEYFWDAYANDDSEEQYVWDDYRPYDFLENDYDEAYNEAVHDWYDDPNDYREYQKKMIKDAQKKDVQMKDDENKDNENEDGKIAFPVFPLSIAFPNLEQLWIGPQVPYLDPEPVASWRDKWKDIWPHLKVFVFNRHATESDKCPPQTRLTLQLLTNLKSLQRIFLEIKGKCWPCMFSGNRDLRPDLDVFQHSEFQNLRSFNSRTVCISPDGARTLLSNAIKSNQLTSFDIVFPDTADADGHLKLYDWLRGNPSIQALGFYKRPFPSNPKNDEDLLLPQFLATFPNLRTLTISYHYTYPDLVLAARELIAILKVTHLKTIYMPLFDTSFDSTLRRNLKQTARDHGAQLMNTGLYLTEHRPNQWPVPPSALGE